MRVRIKYLLKAGKDGWIGKVDKKKFSRTPRYSYIRCSVLPRCGRCIVSYRYKQVVWQRKVYFNTCVFL